MQCTKLITVSEINKSPVRVARISKSGFVANKIGRVSFFFFFKGSVCDICGTTKKKNVLSSRFKIAIGSSLTTHRNTRIRMPLLSTPPLAKQDGKKKKQVENEHRPFAT